MKLSLLLYATYAFSLGMLACKQAEWEPCAKPNDCQTGLTCFLNTCQTPETIQVLMEMAREKSCRDTDKCRNYGKCTYEDGKCVARSDKDCKNSQGCKDDGRCILFDDKCI